MVIGGMIYAAMGSIDSKAERDTSVEVILFLL
jgi:hypothetical protein